MIDSLKQNENLSAAQRNIRLVTHADSYAITDRKRLA
jgi:hypothetical protein